MTLLAVVIAQLLDPVRWVLALIAFFLCRRPATFEGQFVAALTVVVALAAGLSVYLHGRQSEFVLLSFFSGLISWSVLIVTPVAIRWWLRARSARRYAANPDPFYERHKAAD